MIPALASDRQCQCLCQRLHFLDHPFALSPYRQAIQSVFNESASCLGDSMSPQKQVVTPLVQHLILNLEL